MVYTDTMQRALDLSLRTHEISQKQKRKEKDVPYIVHPMTVGLILAQAKAPDHVVIAGILHDTIEESAPEFRIDTELIAEQFGDDVAHLVDAVTERSDIESWEAQKVDMLVRVVYMNEDEVMLKSADVIATMRELIEDHTRYGDTIFEQFSVPKEKTCRYYVHLARMLYVRYPKGRLALDLKKTAKRFRRLM